MLFTYEIVDTEYNTQFIRRSDGAIIPLDLSNSDYQEYLAWLENPNAESITPTL
jgi:hypothetical protein